MKPSESLPQLVIISPDPPSLAYTLVARMLDLGIPFFFEKTYQLPKTIAPEMSAAKVVVAPMEREDIEAPKGGRLIRLSTTDWTNPGKIERIPMRGGLKIHQPGFFQWMMHHVSPEEQIEATIKRIHQTKTDRWSDVDRYHLECLLRGGEIYSHLFPWHQTQSLAQRIIEKWPQEITTCDQVAVTYPLMDYAKKEGDTTLIRRCRKLVDDFLSHTSKSFGVLSNFTSPWETGIARSEIIFQVCPALVRLSKLTDTPLYKEIALEQWELLDRLLTDEKTGLWYLGYAETGPSASLWARGCTFHLRMLVDLLAAYQADLPEKLLHRLQKTCSTLCDLQSPTGGFCQVLDEPDTRLETSATAWIAASLFKGMSYGLLEKKYHSVAEAALAFVQGRLWDGLSSSLCGATTVSQDKEYYRSRPFVTAAYGHFTLLALLEHAFYLKKHE